MAEFCQGCSARGVVHCTTASQSGGKARAEGEGAVEEKKKKMKRGGVERVK